MAKIEYYKAKDGYAIRFVGGRLDGGVVIRESRRPVLRNRNFEIKRKGRVVLGSFYTPEQEEREEYNRQMGIA